MVCVRVRVCVFVYRARKNAVHRLRLVDRALTEQSPLAITPEHPGEPGSPWGPPMHGRQMGSESLSLWEPVSSAVKQKPKRHVTGWREARRHTDGCPQWALRGHPVPQVAHIITQPVLTTIRIPILEVRKVGCRKTRKLAHEPPINCSAGIQAQATSLQRSSVRSPAHAGSTGQLQTHTCKSRKERNPQGNKSSSNDNTVRASEFTSYVSGFHPRRHRVALRRSSPSHPVQVEAWWSPSSLAEKPQDDLGPLSSPCQSLHHTHSQQLSQLPRLQPT